MFPNSLVCTLSPSPKNRWCAPLHQAGLLALPRASSGFRSFDFSYLIRHHARPVLSPSSNTNTRTLCNGRRPPGLLSRRLPEGKTVRAWKAAFINLAAQQIQQAPGRGSNNPRMALHNARIAFLPEPNTFKTVMKGNLTPNPGRNARHPIHRD